MRPHEAVLEFAIYASFAFNGLDILEFQFKI